MRYDLDIKTGSADHPMATLSSCSAAALFALVISARVFGPRPFRARLLPRYRKSLFLKALIENLSAPPYLPSSSGSDLPHILLQRRECFPQTVFFSSFLPPRTIKPTSMKKILRSIPLTCANPIFPSGIRFDQGRIQTEQARQSERKKEVYSIFNNEYY